MITDYHKWHVYSGVEWRFVCSFLSCSLMVANSEELLVGVIVGHYFLSSFFYSSIPYAHILSTLYVWEGKIVKKGVGICTGRHVKMNNRQYAYLCSTPWVHDSH